MALLVAQDAMRQASPCQVAALQKCLKDNDGDGSKCAELIEEFSKSCSPSKKNNK